MTTKTATHGAPSKAIATVLNSDHNRKKTTFKFCFPSELQLIDFGALSFYSEIMEVCLETSLGENFPFFISEVSIPSACRESFKNMTQVKQRIKMP